MTIPAPQASAVDLLDPDEHEQVLHSLPAALLTVDPEAHVGQLVPTRILDTVGIDPHQVVRLDDLVEPVHLASALALLAQTEPRPVPTSTRLGLTTREGTLEALATCRRVEYDDEPTMALLELVPAPATDVDESQLSARQELLAEAERVARLGSWDWDIAADEVTWSDEMFRVYGFEPGAFEVTLDRVLELTIPEDRDYTRSVIEHGLATQLPFTYAHRVLRPDGEVRTLHSRGVVAEVDDAGHPLHLVGACQDVTAQYDLQELGRQYRELYERERRVAGQLREVDALKDALVAAVSHDLRTPLTVIVGSATTLRDHGPRLDRTTRRALLDNLIEHASRLHEMLSDLLDLDRLRRGDAQPQRRPTALLELVRGVVDHAHATSVTVSTRGEVIAEVDAPKVERIVDNLVRNAVRHTPPDTPIWVRVEQDERNAVITVEDAGPGVPSAARERIFEPFERSVSRGAARSGSGLGLAIVSEFARLHGGSASVGEREGGGASFVVRLPLHPR